MLPDGSTEATKEHVCGDTDHCNIYRFDIVCIDAGCRYRGE